MPHARFAITHEPLAIETLVVELERAAQAQSEGCGAVCTFVGIVRATHQGRRVRHLEYEAFEPLALRAFERIRAEMAHQWPGTRVAIHHRIGRLLVGEASIAIAVASAHRAEAFRACRYAIERVKQIAPVWKHEYFDDGDAWVEGATTDVDDDAARRQAMDVACA